MLCLLVHCFRSGHKTFYTLDVEMGDGLFWCGFLVFDGVDDAFSEVCGIWFHGGNRLNKKGKCCKWQKALDFPNDYKQLLVLLKKKYLSITKKKYEFRYVLPARGNVIRAVVQWADTGDYKMPQLLDLAYIKLSNGKWSFVALP